MSLRRKKNAKKKNQRELIENQSVTADEAVDTSDSSVEDLADNKEETNNTEWDNLFWSESEGQELAESDSQEYAGEAQSEELWSEQPLVLGPEEENPEEPVEAPEDVSLDDGNPDESENQAKTESEDKTDKKRKKKKNSKKENPKDSKKANKKDKKKVSKRLEQDVRKFTKVARFRGIRTKLIGAFLIPVCLFIVVGIIIYNKSSSGLQDNAEELTYTSVDMLREYFELGFENIELSATRLSVSEDIGMHFTGLYGRDYEISSKVAIVNEAVADRYISSIFVFGSEVKNIITSEGVKKKTLYDEFVASEEGKKVEESMKETGNDFCWISSHPSADEVLKINEADYSLALVKQLLDSKNKPCGYIVIDVKTSFIQQILDNASVGDKAIKAFVTSDGRQVISGSDDMDMCSQSFYQDIVDEEEGGYKYITYDGEEYLFLYSKTKTGDGIVTAMVPKTVILEKAYEIRNYTVITIIACCLIAVLCGSMLALGIAKTIRKVNAVMKQTSEGDLTGNLKINRKDEFRILAGNIMNMITSIKGLIVKMTKVSSQVNESSNQVGDNSEVLYKATKDITEAIGYIESGLIQQSEDTENCMNQMSDLSERINVVSGRTSEIGNIAVQTQETVNNGMVIVKELGSRVQDTTDITKAIIEDISQLEKESKAINSIIATINEIADETNLLSLNATIEAARAGEAGRGFAVVSAEIRKLAEQSAEAGTQIKGIIAQIQARMAQTIATAERAEDIVNYQAESLNTTVKVFEDIRSQVEILTTDLETISDNINGIENLKNDTLDAIASISATSNQTEAASTELTKSAERQMKAVEELNVAVSKLQVNSTELDESVSIFKVGNAIIEEMDSDSAQDSSHESEQETLAEDVPYEEPIQEETSYEEEPYEETLNEESAYGETTYEETLNEESSYEEAPYEESEYEETSQESISYEDLDDTQSLMSEIPSLEDFPEENNNGNE